jgi:hypothetical protein
VLIFLVERQNTMTPEMKKLLVAPLMGGLFVIFMPAVVWVLIVQAIWQVLQKKLRPAMAPLPMTMGVAYFAGKGESEPGPSNAKLDILANEIAEKR